MIKGNYSQTRSISTCASIHGTGKPTFMKTHIPPLRRGIRSMFWYQTGCCRLRSHRSPRNRSLSAGRLRGQMPDKISKARKQINLTNAFLIRPDIESVVSKIKENTEWHWTLFFENGRRLEMYPSKMGLHNQGRWLKYLTPESLLRKVKRFSVLPKIEPDNFDLIDDEKDN